MQPALLFDRDGIVNELVDRGDNLLIGGKKVRFTAPWTRDELRIFPEIPSVIRDVQEKGYLPIIITNQPDRAYGMMSEEEYSVIHAEVMKLGFIDAFACRHRRDDGCSCRKPKPGLLHKAAKKWDIDLPNSFFVGDNDTDIEAARAAGCHGVLLKTPYNGHASASFVIRSIGELPRWIPPRHHMKRR